MKYIIPLFMSVFILGAARAEIPVRAVSIGGANTEILYSLDLSAKIVGSDTTSIYPSEARETPKVGYMRALSAEGILSLNPDLILLSEEAGPPPVIAQLNQVGVEILILKAARSIDDIKDNIVKISNRFGAEASARTLLAGIDADVAKLRQALSGVKNRNKVLFILQHGGGAPMVAGTGTAANSIIELSGAVNAVSAYSGYKPLTPEAAAEMQPDFILVTKMGLKQAGGVDGFVNIPGINLTKAAQNRKIIAMESLYLLGYGPRTAKAALELHHHYEGGN